MSEAGQASSPLLLERWEKVRSGRGREAAVFSPGGAVLRTFAEIENGAEQWSRALASAGPVVAIQLGNAPELPEVLLGVWRAGHGAVLFDADLCGERRDAIEKLCGVAMRVEHAPGGPVLRRAAGGGSRTGDFFKLTSGTTAEPKAIRFSAAQLVADCDAVCETMGITEEDRNFGVISFSHSYGFSNLVTPLLCRGVPLVAGSDLLHRAVIEGLSASGATVFPGLPALFAGLAEFDSLPMRLRLCISAGAPLGSAVAERFRGRWGCKIHSFYGATECGGICYDSGDDPAPPEGFVGPPLKGVTVEHPGGTSPIRVISPAAGCGYVPPEPGGALGNGTFSPSDLLTGVAGGYVISGRLSDFINIAGRKVNPAEIERALEGCPGVREIVVLGLPDKARGEEIAACVAGEVTEAELRRFGAARLPPWQMPRRWVFWEEIPRNARGKISRSALREKLAAL